EAAFILADGDQLARSGIVNTIAHPPYPSRKTFLCKYFVVVDFERIVTFIHSSGREFGVFWQCDGALHPSNRHIPGRGQRFPARIMLVQPIIPFLSFDPVA